MSSTNTLEILPNEILIQCLKYLNAWDLFHAFDHLNARFSALIQSIPLYFNFANVSNFDVQQFCLNIKKNSSIKQQVHALHLSDEKTLQHAEIFLSSFSFDEFSSLKSLVLTQIQCDQYSPYSIREILQSLHDLSCFVLDPCDKSFFMMPDDVSLSKIKRLSIPNLCENHLMFNQQWLTTSLTLSSTLIQQIMKIFQCATELRDLSIDYLHMKNEHFMYSNELQNLQRCSAMHLKRLRIKTFTSHFQLIENLLQCTPNLKFLTVIGSRAKEMIDADRWEKLIRCSLIYLTFFQFQFSFLKTEFSDTNTNFLSKFERFKGNFWTKEHQWPVRCEYSASSFLVHTIPYSFNEYKLSLSTEHYSLQVINPKSVFDCVTKISVPYEVMQTPLSYYFTNVKILRLIDNSTSRRFDRNYVLDHEHIKSLTSMICLSNITDLWIDRTYSLNSSSVMMRLLKETSNISSLTIDLQMFRLFCIDAQVCLTLKTKIKSLFLLSNGYDFLFSGSYSFEQFYETFSELGELECDLDKPSEFITLIHSLSKLSNIAVCFPRWYSSRDFEKTWFRDYVYIIDRDFRCTSEYVISGRLTGDIKRFVFRFKRTISNPVGEDEE